MFIEFHCLNIDSIEEYEDNSAVGFPSHPDAAEGVFWDDHGEENQWDEIVRVGEPRHLAKRSPVPPFDPFTKKNLKKGNLKLWKPPIKKVAKKLAKVSVPLAGAGGSGLLATFGINQVPGGLGGIFSLLPSGVWRPSIG